MSMLPESLERPNIYRMQPGDTGWTLYWAMQATSNRQLWIRGDYPVFDQPDPDGIGGVERFMRIERTSTGINVYQDTIPTKAQWDAHGDIQENWKPLIVTLI